MATSTPTWGVWEVIETSGPTKRQAVVGGWLVVVGNGVTPATAFIPDPTWSWTLASPVVVTPVTTPVTTVPTTPTAPTTTTTPITATPVTTPVTTVPTAPVVTPARPGHAKSLGLNLSAVEDYAVQVPFNDMMAMSRDWISHPLPGGVWDDGRAIDVDANGYVRSLLDGQQPGTLISFTNGLYARPAGMYVLTWDGLGTVVLSGTTVTKTEANRITFTYKPTDQNMEVRVTAIPDKTNYPRNMHCFEVGVTARWDARFLALFPKAATFRFMDWGRTNDSTLANWADRPTLASRSQSGVTGGVSLEAMVDLCNTTNTSGWFNVPHLATDDYVLQMATLLKNTLNANLKCHVEFSNECWNGQFQQATWCKNQGLAAGISNDPWVAQISYYSRRARQVMDIFKSVFGTDTRLVRVMSGQGVNIGVTSQVLGFENAAKSCDAYAIADYFGYEIGGGSATVANAFVAMTPDQQMDTIASSSAAQTTYWTQQIAALKPYGIPLVAYEGGPHLVGVGANQSNVALEAAFDAAAVNSRMGTIITSHLAAWKGAGGGLFCYFASMGAPSKFGNWGLMTNMQDTKAPKLLAFQAATVADAT